jgi:hypothetical protein
MVAKPTDSTTTSMLEA